MNEELMDLMMGMVSVDSDLNGLLTLLELSRQRGDLHKIMPLVKKKLPELAQRLKELSEKIPDANG